MPESVIPGVYIDVRAEGLIRPGIIGLGNIGIVGTASKGPINEAVIIGSYTEAREVFGEYDMWIDGNSNELTLVRALEQAYNNGAGSVVAVRIGDEATAAPASVTLSKNPNTVVTLMAKTPGTWGNALSVNVGAADANAFVENRELLLTGSATIDLGVTGLVQSPLNRVQVVGAGAPLTIIYTGAPQSGQVTMDTTAGTLQFGDAVPNGGSILVSYAVAAASARKVTVKYGDLTPEEYIIVNGNDLANDINRTSVWLSAEADSNAANAAMMPDASTEPDVYTPFTGGNDGLAGADHVEGLLTLLNEDAHIILAAGLDNVTAASDLAGHCAQASTDLLKRDRIAVVGSGIGASLNDILAHNVASDRVIFVAPGIRVRDNAPDRPSTEDPMVTLPGSYAAAAVAGMIATRDPETSLTNKVINVPGLEQVYTPAQMEQLIKSRVLVLERRQGFRVLKGITTSANPAWSQITTRRIVDYAKYGTRSAASPFIGRLNNERVRSALHASVNSLLASMVLDEMLTGYELEVTATRDDEIRGIARVTMTLQPTFSIDYIRVTMNLQ